MEKYIPQVEHRRHQRHVDAFVRARWAYEISALVSKYIYDPAISPMDADDLDLLKVFLFDNGLGKIHISYYSDQLVNTILNSKKRRVKAIRKICRYADFLIRINTLMTIDLFHHVFQLRDNFKTAEDVFNGISPYTRVSFVHAAIQWPNIVNRIPKLKLYVTFS